MASNLVAVDPRCDLIRMERTTMVTKMEDRVKVGLVEWSKVIQDQLKLCDPGSLPHTPEMISRIAVQFNQGALLQYQYGEIERAEILCRAEIELFTQLSSCSGDRALCLANMVPPYINLARIYGQKGEVERSLSIFEEIYRFGVQQQDLSIFDHQIPVADGPAMFVAAPGYQKVMLSCRVVETARVLQIIEDYSALLALAETNQSLPEFQDAFFRQYLLEVRSRALLYLGQYERALEALSDCCRQMPLNTTDRIVVHYLLSQIYRKWGRNQLAAETLDKLESHLAGVEKYGRKLPVLRQIAYRLALERHLLGDNARALGPAQKAFQWCSELSDQPGSIRTAILLLRICGDENGNAYSPAMQYHWYEQLRQLASTTFFRLDRACAFWELGLVANLIGDGNKLARNSAFEFLLNSYTLYRSMPFLESRQSAEVVKQLLESQGLGFEVDAAVGNESAWENSAAIDSVFDALMEYAPKSFAARQQAEP